MKRIKKIILLTSKHLNAMKTELKDNLNELNAKGQTCVKLEKALDFLRICSAFGIIVFAGAINDDVTAQWFYM